MATQTEIEAVVDRVLAAFDSDPVKWEAFLTRGRLMADLDSLSSQMRVAETAEQEQNATFQEQKAALQEQINQAQAALDAL